MTVLSLGYMPPVNQMVPIGAGAAAAAVVSDRPAALRQMRTGAARPRRRSGHHLPAGISLHQRHDQAAARQLRRTASASRRRCSASAEDDLVVDIGSNDGTLISNFQKAGHRILGIEPTDVGEDRQRARHPDHPALFRQGRRARGEGASMAPAKVDHRRQLLRPYRGRACDRRGHRRDARRPTACSSRSRITSSACSTRCNTTPIYHEHLRYYSVGSLKHLLEMHGLEVFHARPIPSHGGSIRVYAARKGTRPVQASVAARCWTPSRAATRCASGSQQFRDDVMLSKLRLHAHDPRPQGKGRPHRRHQRAVARLDPVQLCRARRGDHRLCLRNRRLAEDRQVHAGHR